MFKDFKKIFSNKVMEYDICIIGSGPAGISVAKQLLETNKRIAILESGGLEIEDEYHDLNQGINSGPNYLSLDNSRLRCFGGAGKLWAGHCVPFKKDEFDKKLFIPLSGWPISLDDLKIYYKKAADMLGISYEKFFDENLFGNTYEEKSFNELNSNGSLITSNIKQISSSINRDFSEKYKKEFINSKNLDVIYHATVICLNSSDNAKNIKSVTLSDLNDNKALLKAKIFVLACGALENPRILLNSNKTYKNGIGNENGMVGSCFMSHPSINEVAEVKKNKQTCVSYDKSIDYKVNFEVSSKERYKQKILRHSINFVPSKNQINSKHQSYKSGLSDYFKILNNTNLFNRIFCKAIFDKEFSSKNWVINIGLEQPPLMSNKINLDKMKDKLGMPLINLYWAKLSKIEEDTVIKAVKNTARTLGLQSSGRIKFTDELLNGSAFNFDDPINHHIGTTRMSDNPKTGVVDKNCKVFGILNLYITGSSNFPTSSIANPTYTIVALSLRLGEYLKNIKL